MKSPISTVCFTATAGSVIGAFSQSELITWTGAAIAIGSAIATAMLAAYHKVREAHRQEALADIAAGVADKAHADNEDLKALIGNVRGRIDDLHERLAAISYQRDELLKHVLKLADEAIEARCPFAGRSKPSEVTDGRSDSGAAPDVSRKDGCG